VTAAPACHVARVWARRSDSTEKGIEVDGPSTLLYGGGWPIDLIGQYARDTAKAA